MASNQQGGKPVEVRGVFSTQEIRKVGTGTTTRKTVQKTFWFIEQKGDKLECQPLNPNYVPSGPKKNITMDELIAKFSPEPEFYMNSVYPKMKELNQTIDSADKNRANGNNFSAEYEYGRALKVDEENIRANFGIGLTYLERGDSAKAKDIFERLVKLDGAFQPEHKHLFNDFGINLRKSKMLTQALDYYTRAQQLSPNDENLYMNIARVQLEMKKTDDCLANLLKALSLDPQHEASIKFLNWLIRKNMVPAGKKGDVDAALAAAKNAPPRKPAAAGAPAVKADSLPDAPAAKPAAPAAPAAQAARPAAPAAPAGAPAMKPPAAQAGAPAAKPAAPAAQAPAAKPAAPAAKPAAPAAKPAAPAAQAAKPAAPAAPAGAPVMKPAAPAAAPAGESSKDDPFAAFDGKL